MKEVFISPISLKCKPNDHIINVCHHPPKCKRITIFHHFLGTTFLQPKSSGKVSLVGVIYIAITNCLGALIGVAGGLIAKPGNMLLYELLLEKSEDFCYICNLVTSCSTYLSNQINNIFRLSMYINLPPSSKVLHLTLDS